MENEHVLDATNKKLGRIASEAACLLMGKHEPSFERHQSSADVVRITNASKLHLPERKRLTTEYTRYSGHPGGLKRETLDSLIARKGHEEAVRKAVFGMLPGNKLRARAMKRLFIDA